MQLVILIPVGAGRRLECADEVEANAAGMHSSPAIDFRTFRTLWMLH